MDRDSNFYKLLKVKHIGNGAVIATGAVVLEGVSSYVQLWQKFQPKLKNIGFLRNRLQFHSKLNGGIGVMKK